MIIGRVRNTTCKGKDVQEAEGAPKRHTPLLQDTWQQEGFLALIPFDGKKKEEQNNTPNQRPYDIGRAPALHHATPLHCQEITDNRTYNHQKPGNIHLKELLFQRRFGGFDAFWNLVKEDECSCSDRPAWKINVKTAKRQYQMRICKQV